MARRRHGTGRFDALLDACHKRARPILMTTLAMGAGMLPNALGGLLTSTVPSLIVIPVVFTCVDDGCSGLRGLPPAAGSTAAVAADRFLLVLLTLGGCCGPFPGCGPDGPGAPAARGRANRSRPGRGAASMWSG